MIGLAVGVRGTGKAVQVYSKQFVVVGVRVKVGVRLGSDNSNMHKTQPIGVFDQTHSIIALRAVPLALSFSTVVAQLTSYQLPCINPICVSLLVYALIGSRCSLLRFAAPNPASRLQAAVQPGILCMTLAKSFGNGKKKQKI